jgi:sugar lactone lactonase YvrE
LVACGARSSLGTRSVDVGDAAGADGGAPAVLACHPGDPPVLLAEGEADAIAIDRTHVYWSGPGGVRRVPKVGGKVDELGGGRSIISIAVDDTHFYVANREYGSIWRTPKTGGESETLARAQVQLWSLAVDETNMYWGNSTVDTVDHVDRITKSTSAYAQLDSFDGNPVSLAIAASDVVYGTGRTGRVRAVAKRDGVVRTLIDSESFVWDVAAAGEAVYVTSLGERGKKGGRVLRLSLDTNEGPRVLAADQTYPYGVATDGAFVYWTDRIDRTIKKVSATVPSMSTTLLTTEGLPWDVVVDESCVYVTIDSAPAGVYRLPK